MRSFELANLNRVPSCGVYSSAENYSAIGQVSIESQRFTQLSMYSQRAAWSTGKRLPPWVVRRATALVGRVDEGFKLLLRSLAVVALGGLLNPSIATDMDGNVAISFHQLRFDKLASEYTLEVYPDGRVTYVGLSNVRTKGVHNFKVEPAEVVGLMRAIQSSQLRRLEPGQQEKASKRRPISRFRVRPEGSGEMVEFFVSDISRDYADLLATIEKHVPTMHLRCPFHWGSEDPGNPSKLPGRSVDVCDFMDLRRYYK